MLEEAGIDRNGETVPLLNPSHTLATPPHAAPLVAGLPTLCESCPEKSLLQLFNMLLSSIDSAFTAVAVREGGREGREGEEREGMCFFTHDLCVQDTTGSSMSVSHYGHVHVEGEDRPTNSM